MKYQPKTKQKRVTIASCALKSINDCVERDALRWNASKSWIIATALAAFYGIDIIKPYETKERRKKSNRVWFEQRNGITRRVS